MAPLHYNCNSMMTGPFENTTDCEEYLKYIEDQEKLYPGDIEQLKSSYEYLARKAATIQYPQDLRDKYVELKCREKIAQLEEKLKK